MSRRQLGRRPFATGWRSFFACVLSLSVIVAPFAAALHRAFVPHVVCEHGDLVETGESASARGELDARTSQGGEATVGERPASDGNAHGHDHCSVGTLARKARCSHSPPLVLTGQLDAAIVLLGAQTIRWAWPVLLRAPKTSPPPLRAT